MIRFTPGNNELDLDDLRLAADTTVNAYRMAAVLAVGRPRLASVTTQLGEAAGHLLQAGYALDWGTGLRSRVLGAVYTKVFWRRRQHPWPHHHEAGHRAVAELALVHTGKVKGQVSTAANRHIEPPRTLRRAAVDVTRAWLRLGQIHYALETGTDLNAPATEAPGAVQSGATLDWITAIVDGVTPLAVEMARRGTTRTQAVAAGLTTLAHHNLINALTLLHPGFCLRPELDLAGTRVSVAPFGHTPIAERHALLDDLSRETHRVAAHIASDYAQPGAAAHLTRAAKHLTAARGRIHHTANP